MEKLLKHNELLELKILIKHTKFLFNINKDLANHFYKAYFSNPVDEEYMLSKFKFSILSSDAEYMLSKFKFSILSSDILSKLSDNEPLNDSLDLVNELITCYIYYNYKEVYNRLKDIYGRSLEFKNIKKSVPTIGPLRDKFKIHESQYDKIKRLISDNNYEWYFSIGIDGCDSLKMINNINPLSYPYNMDDILDNMIPFRTSELSELNDYIGSVVDNKVNYFLKKVDRITIIERTGDVEILLYIDGKDCRYNELGEISIINSVNIICRDKNNGELEILYKYNFKNEEFRHDVEKGLSILVKLTR